MGSVAMLQRFDRREASVFAERTRCVMLALASINEVKRDSEERKKQR